MTIQTVEILDCIFTEQENAFVVDLVLRSLYPTLESTLRLLQYTHKKVHVHT